MLMFIMAVKSRLNPLRVNPRVVLGRLFRIQGFRRLHQILCLLTPQQMRVHRHLRV